MQQFLLPFLGIVRTLYTGACISANETANQQSLTYCVLLVHLNTCMWLVLPHAIVLNDANVLSRFAGISRHGRKLKFWCTTD